MAENEEDKSYQLIDPEGSPKVGKQVFEILGKVIEDKKKLGLHDRWKRNHELRRNKHWKDSGPSGLPLSSANMIFTHTQRTTNELTDNDPTFNVAGLGKSEEQQKEQLADLQRTTEFWWRDREMQDILESLVINGEQYGITVCEVIFNPDIEFGLGEAEAIPIDPYFFGWYPLKLSYIRDLQQCEAVLRFTPKSVRELRAKYPAKAKQIKPDTELVKELMVDERREVDGESVSASVMTTFANTVRELLNFTGNAGDDSGDEETLLCEMWLRDRTRVSKGGYSMPKYTGEIRYIKACSAKVVLEDRDNPSINPNIPKEQALNTYLFDKYPFTAANSIKDTSNAWGFSDYEDLEGLNMEVNKALSQFVIEKDRSARKKLINPLDTGVPNDHFTNYVGIINPSTTESSQGIRWMETPPSSVDYDKAIAMFKDFFMLISGTFDVDQAQQGGREVIAYKAIAALMERAATMKRGKIRSYSRLIRDIGRMYLSHVMNWYTEERWITYKDENGKEASKPIIGSSLLMPAKLTVVSGSTMPISRVQQREEALALFTNRAIDQQELLDKLDWSNRDEVVKRTMAGPLGAVMEKMKQVQVPPPVMEYLKAVAEMDPKELQRELEQGKFPLFMQFAQKLMAQAQGQPPAGPTGPEAAEMAKIQAEAQKIMAEKAKVEAERDLTIEKTVTERVEQNVKMAGVSFDDESLKIQRAKMVADMDREAKGTQTQRVEMALDNVQRDADRRHEHAQNLMTMADAEADRKHDMTKTAIGTAVGAIDSAESRAYDASQAEAGREHEVKQTEFQAKEHKADLDHDKEKTKMTIEAKPVSAQGNRPGHNERGLRSNNVEE